MNIRRVKRICDVRGCKNIGSFAIAKTREIGNTVIICEDCLREGLEAIKNYTPEPKRENLNAPPPLFFNATSEVEDKTESKEEQYICSECGKEFKSAAGLQSHMRSHKADSSEGDDVE